MVEEVALPIVKSVVVGKPFAIPSLRIPNLLVEPLGVNAVAAV